eukprot:m.1247198 g.1247198  ORF g.1247198 m.1247198 type:complete len:504 (-) comp24690_c1_seq11:2701-4212(-)
MSKHDQSVDENEPLTQIYPESGPPSDHFKRQSRDRSCSPLRSLNASPIPEGASHEPSFLGLDRLPARFSTEPDVSSDRPIADGSTSPLRPLISHTPERPSTATDRSPSSLPSTPSRCPSGARSVPATPPPCYGHFSRGNACTDGALDSASTSEQDHADVSQSAHGSSASVTSFSTPPRVGRRERSQLLMLPAVDPSQQPVTPPPTYPSPPDYQTPPRGEHGLPVSRYSLANLAGDDDYIDMNDEETALHELAPEYKDDVGFLAGVKHSGHVICLLLTVLLYTLVILYFVGVVPWLNAKPRNFEVALFAIYAMYVIEGFGCSTSNLLWNHMTAPEAHEHFQKMLDAAPWMRWHLINYHYRPGQNESQARSKDRLISSSKTVLYPLQGCLDDTAMRFFTSHRLCQYRFCKERVWQDAAAEVRYEALKEAFIEENKRDEHYQLDLLWGMDDWVDGFLASRPGQPRPWWARWSVFACFQLAGLSFFYRTFFASRVGKQTITIRKVLF